jgi:GDP-4-dehydro-6-deoxy-D-mannose reductase
VRALVTGGAGFVGRHLVARLLEDGARVVSLDRRPDALEGAQPLVADLADAAAAREAVRASAPDVVYHLASRTPASAPDATPVEWLGGDPAACFHLLEAVRAAAPAARVVVVSSSAVYGHVPAGALPIREEQSLEPVTLYGLAKASVETVALRFARAHRLHVVRARPFNLVGPGEPRGMLTSTLAAQVAAIARGETEPVVRMRHRATARDYTDVRDAARAYCLLAGRGAPGEAYNVCSGRAVAIGVLADRLLALAGVSARVEETATSAAPDDVVAQAGDRGKLARATGWSPALSLDRSLTDLLASLRG